MITAPYRIAIAVIFAWRATLAWSECAVLARDGRVNSISADQIPACVLVKVEEMQPVRISITQPEDLQLNVRSGSLAVGQVDGFAFGIESVTLVRAGEYRVEVSAASGIRRFAFDVFSEGVSDRKATRLTDAEQQATKSKASGSIADNEASLALWEVVGDQPAITRTYLKLGSSFLAVGNAFRARELYERAYENCRRDSDNRCLAEAANNSGLAAEQVGEFTVALGRLEEAAEGWKKESNPVFAGRTLSNMGLLYRRIGDYGKAISFYDRARIVLRKADAVSYARVLNNLGICYTTLSEYGRALTYLRSALDQYRQHPSPRDSVRARLNLGRTLMLSGSTGLAETALNLALEESGGDKAARADVLNNLGQLAWHRRQYQSGRKQLEQALVIYTEIKDRRGAASALHYLGLICAAMGDTAAHTYLDRAATTRIDLRLRDDAADSLYELANLAYGEGDLTRAKELVERALSLLEDVRMQVPTPALRASFYSNKRRIFELLLEITMSGTDPDTPSRGLVMAERGRARALLDVLAARAASGKMPTELLERRVTLQRRIDVLTTQLSSNPGAAAEIRRKLELLIAEDAETETRVRQAIDDDWFGVPLKVITPVQQRMPADTALIEFQLGERRSYVWLVDAQGVRVFSLPPYPTFQSRITEALTLYHDATGRRRSPEKQQRFERAIAHVSSLLLGSFSTIPLPPRLVIVPDRALHYFPFAALPIGRSGERMGLKYDLLQVPAASYLVAGRLPRSPTSFPKAILAVTDPVFSVDDPRVQTQPGGRGLRTGSFASFARLPFASDMQPLDPVVPPSRRVHLRGFAARLGALDAQPLKDFAVLYLSTHAIIDDHTPELSRIVLSQVNSAGNAVDGFLRPYHFTRFQLQGPVIVLAACETAKGKETLGEGLTGFTNNLFSAGAAQLVLSLDQVDAEATAQFFNDAFQYYFGAGAQGMEHAMTLSRRRMATSSRWSDPYYWASLIVVGQPTPARQSR